MTEILRPDIKTKIIETANHYGSKVILSPTENGIEITPSVNPNKAEVEATRQEVLDSAERFKNLLQVMGELANGYGRRAHYDVVQFGEGVIIGEEMPNYKLQPDEIYGITPEDSIMKKT